MSVKSESVKLEVGDVVMLNSGSPDLTVTDTAALGSDIVWCKWFNGCDTVTDKFPAKSLTKVESK